MSAPLPIAVSLVAADQIRAAEAWWQRHRPSAPGAVREDLERAASLLALQPQIGARARNVTLPDVRRLHLTRLRYDLYYRVAESPRRLEILGFWHASRGAPPEL